MRFFQILFALILVAPELLRNFSLIEGRVANASSIAAKVLQG